MAKAAGNGYSSRPTDTAPVVDSTARARRQMMHDDVDAQLIGQTLQLKLPQPHPRAIAATAIRGDGQPCGMRIAHSADIAPPVADCPHREGGGVAAHADTHPSGVGRQIIDAIRHRTAKFLDQEIMHPDFLGLPLGTPYTAGVLEIPDKLLLLCVDRDHRLARGQRHPHAVVEMVELGVAIGMGRPLAGLAIGLQAELLLMQEFTDQGAADPVTLSHQRPRQLRQAFACPSQRRHGVAACAGLDQRQQIGHQHGILRHTLLAPATVAAHAPQVQQFAGGHFLQAPPNRARGNPGGARHRGDAAIPSRFGLCCRQYAPRPLVQMVRKGCVAFANRSDIDHPLPVTTSALQGNRSSRHKPSADSVIFGRGLSIARVAP